ncbi:unnamed protein product, partial [marine sediment metagenome]
VEVYIAELNVEIETGIGKLEKELDDAFPN